MIRNSYIHILQAEKTFQRTGESIRYKKFHRFRHDAPTNLCLRCKQNETGSQWEVLWLSELNPLFEFQVQCRSPNLLLNFIPEDFLSAQNDPSASVLSFVGIPFLFPSALLWVLLSLLFRFQRATENDVKWLYYYYLCTRLCQNKIMVLSTVQCSYWVVLCECTDWRNVIHFFMMARKKNQLL